MRRLLLGGTSWSLCAVVLLASSALAAGPTERLSVSSARLQADGDSQEPAVSANGRLVAFTSRATNLVAGGDANGTLPDVFVHDRQTRKTTRVSVNSDGVQADSESHQPSISADGRFVAFNSSATNLVPGSNLHNAYVHDRRTGDTRMVSVNSAGEPAAIGDSAFTDPEISLDGRFVVFRSGASNLVPGDTNGSGDIFVHELRTGKTERVSVNGKGTQADGNSTEPTISADGRFVAFVSFAGNLVPGTAGGGAKVFVHDRRTGLTKLASTGQLPGEAFRPSISAGGRFVAFDSVGNTSEVFVHDRTTGATRAVGDGSSASIDGSGRFVAFTSLAVGSAPSAVMVFDRNNGATRRVSVSSAGRPANNRSGDPSISANGRFIAFESLGSNLVPRDTNGALDVFFRRR